MMQLAHKFEKFITNVINKNFSNANITFQYLMLPISYYNEKEFIDDSFKLANSGYSFLLPALALGISQSNLSNIKDLENDLLELDKKLIPLSSSFTQSNSSPGAPTKNIEDKSEKTIQNNESLDKGGSN